jgi:pSer/pThr/pTyr-binding forkhead associated (FHA) protein
MDSVGNDLPVLIGQAGPLNGNRWAIAKILLIGRDPSCDVVVPDRQVSRYHARLTPQQEGVMLEDLGSKNGTFYEGKRVDEPMFLQDGGMIQIALVQNFVFLSSDSTIPLGGVLPMQTEAGGRLFLDNRSRRVWVGKEEVLPPLSVPQFRLLQVLYENQGKVVGREDLIKTVWGDEVSEGVSEEAMDALVRRLRDRLSALDPDHQYIITIRGHGLRLDNSLD